MKIALVANTSWYLYNFRRNLMTALKGAGHEVLAIGSPDEYGEQLKAEGFAHRAIPFSQTGTHPARELQTVLALRRELVAAGVDLVLTWTPKGNSYAALALMGRRQPLIANVSGLGRAFVHKNWITLVARRLLKFALGRASVVFFQNSDDRSQFVAHGLVDLQRSQLLPGSGVDLQRFQPRPPRPVDGTCRVLMVGRLLWSKGVAEYVEAARTLRAEDPRWHFQLLGGLDESGTSGVPTALLDEWIAEGLIDYLGTTDDVRDHLAAADCVVLPSYREGVPRSMLEAAAMARPILTTDAPGCRDCVDHGHNGFLFKPEDAKDLARTLNAFISLDAPARAAMGHAGRRKMEEQFDERLVIDQYLSAIQTLRTVQTGGAHIPQ